MGFVAVEEANEDCFLECAKIPTERRLSNRSDLNAFLLLDSLFPGTSDIVAGAEHDKIWLDIDIEALDAVAAEEQMLDLIRCGVMSDDDCLAMFA